MRKRTEFGWMELILGIILTILGIFTMIRPESMLNSIVICYGIVYLIKILMRCIRNMIVLLRLDGS